MDGNWSRARTGYNRYSLFVRKFPPGDLTPRKDVTFAVGIWDSLLTQLKTTFTYCRQYTKVVLFINLLKPSY